MKPADFFDVVVAGAEPVVVGLEELLRVLPSDLVITKISPVESLLMKRRPLLSQAKATGRKHPVGHLELSWFVMIGMTAVVLFAGSVGSPFEKSTVKSW